MQNYINKISKDFGKKIEFSGIIFNKVHPQYLIYSDIKSKIVDNPDWQQKLFTNELKEATTIARAFSQENIDSNHQFILESEDQEIKAQIIGITLDLMRGVRM